MPANAFDAYAHCQSPRDYNASSKMPASARADSIQPRSDDFLFLSLVMFARSAKSLSFLVAVFAASTAVDAQELTIGLIGDSTVATTYGWGPAFATRFADDTLILNAAKNGATLESLSNKLEELLKQNPDYLLIQFGHNDQKKYGPDVYRDKLTSYVERAKDAGVQAIVLSSVTRRNFDKNGKIAPREEGLKANLDAYAKAAREVAQVQNVPFIDLNGISVEHHNQLGPEASAAYNYSIDDTTHFSPLGAAAIAQLIIEELGNTVPEIATKVKSIKELRRD